MSKSRRLARAARLAAMCALLAPSFAHAKDVVLVPLLPKGAENLQAANVTSLIMSELDFRPEFGKVIEIQGNAGNSTCFGSAACLRGLASKGGGEALITGSLTTSSTRFTLDLVYYDAGNIVRRKTFELASDPVAVADGMNGVIYELVTGTTRAADKQDEPAAADFDFSFDDDDDDDDFSFGSADFNAAADDERRRKAEADERRRAEDEARRLDEQRRAEDERRRLEAEQAARRAEEDRRRAEAEQAARRRAEEDRRNLEEQRRRDQEAQAARVAPPEFDPSMISFGEVSSDDITFESIDDIQFASPSSISVERDAPRSRYDDLDSLADLDDGDDIEDLRRAPTTDRTRTERAQPERPTRSTTSKTREGRDDPSVQLRGRVGYSQFYSLGFVTWGAELSIPLASSGLNVLVGVEGYSVNREIPEALWEQLQRTSEWNTIIPFNVGVVYHITDGPVVPYIGADVIAAQYYVNEASGKGSFTVGARGRGGLDIWMNDVVGLNLNASVGAWHGPYWVLIEEGIQNTGVLPQISGGLVVAF